MPPLRDATLSALIATRSRRHADERLCGEVDCSNESKLTLEQKLSCYLTHLRPKLPAVAAHSTVILH